MLVHISFDHDLYHPFDKSNEYVEQALSTEQNKSRSE